MIFFYKSKYCISTNQIGKVMDRLPAVQASYQVQKKYKLHYPSPNSCKSLIKSLDYMIFIRTQCCIFRTHFIACSCNVIFYVSHRMKIHEKFSTKLLLRIKYIVHSMHSQISFHSKEWERGRVCSVTLFKDVFRNGRNTQF